MDDAIQISDQNPLGVTLANATTLAFTMSTPVDPGASFGVNRQPDWLATPVLVPQTGTVE